MASPAPYRTDPGTASATFASPPPDARRELAVFLTGRRARLAPGDVGMVDGRRRRVPGLRREEVAVLAHVSETWYARLEQGRPINVSPSVLGSIADALRLDAPEREYLFTLAGVTPQRPDPRALALPASLQDLLDELRYVPAVVYGPRWDVLLWNRAYALVFGDLAGASELERNVVYQLFLDPNRRRLFPEWEQLARRVVEQFRLSAGRHAGEPSFAALIAHLRERSPEFRAGWDEHRVWHQTEGEKLVDHPVAGRLVFDHASFSLPEAPDAVLLTYTTRPGSPSALALRALLGAPRAGVQPNQEGRPA